MGNIASSIYFHEPSSKEIPMSNQRPSYPYDFGFEADRKLRESKITLQEMKALKLDPEARNYCAHLLVSFYHCQRKNAPFFGLCKDELHHYRHCRTEDYILRMKEYEREKRLRIREAKIAASAAA